MPNAAGHMTTVDVRRMYEMRTRDRMTGAEIARVIGCSEQTVSKHLAGVKRITETHDRRADSLAYRARIYDRFVKSVSAYVPTFGGGA